MTHTLHRLGDKESLKRDYVVLAMSSTGFNREGSAPKLKEIMKIFAKYNPVNMGDMAHTCMARGALPEEMIEGINEKSIVHGVYTDKETVVKVLKELKEADLGISIVVSGIFKEIFDLCKRVSIKGPFTVNVSLGIMGRTELLPDEKILEITTMCGHGMASHLLTEEQIEKVRRGEITAEQAARELAKQCVCGIFNQARAAELIRNYLLNT